MVSFHSLFAVYAFVIGTALGSFALVLADRMHSGKDWVRSRSQCDHCGHVLGPVDLIPVISWTVQNGRCRYCKRSLSFYYPLVELGLGTALTVSYLSLPYTLGGLGTVRFVLWALGLVIMTALVVSDIKWYLLPSKLVYPLAVLAALHRIVVYIADDQTFAGALLGTSAALLIGAGLFWVLNTVSKGKWIGDGDYRFGIALSLFLGDPFLAWIALFMASVFGLLAALPVLLRSQAKRKLQLKIPFGPFLILGLYVTYLFGERIIDWYTRTFIYFS